MEEGSLGILLLYYFFFGLRMDVETVAGTSTSQAGRGEYKNMPMIILDELRLRFCQFSFSISFSCSLFYILCDVLLFPPVVYGIRLQPTFVLVCVLRGDPSRDINCVIPPAYCMLGLLACSEAYEFGLLGTSLSWSR